MRGFNVPESTLQKERNVVVGLEFGGIKSKACGDVTENMGIKGREDLSLRSTSNKDLQRMVALPHCLRQNFEDMAVDSTISALVEAVNNKEMGNNLSGLGRTSSEGVQWVDDECCKLSLKCLFEYPWVSIHSGYDRFCEVGYGGGCLIRDCCYEWIMCSSLCIVSREKETTQESLLTSEILS